MNQTKTPYLVIGERMLSNALDSVLAAWPLWWRGRAFLALGEKNKKCSQCYIGVKRENICGSYEEGICHSVTSACDTVTSNPEVTVIRLN